MDDEKNFNPDFSRRFIILIKARILQYLAFFIVEELTMTTTLPFYVFNTRIHQAFRTYVFLVRSKNVYKLYKKDNINLPKYFEKTKTTIFHRVFKKSSITHKNQELEKKDLEP